VKQVTAVVKKYKHGIKKNVTYDLFFIGGVQIYEENFKIVHDHQGSVKDIKTIDFSTCILTDFPRAQILLDLVKNLTSLSVTECNLSTISRDSLHGLGSLKELFLGFNSIEHLPKGLFEHTPNLEIVSFRSNRIKEINADILDPLLNLQYFNLSNNISISVKYSSYPSTPGNVTLAQLKAEIRKKCTTVGSIIAEMKKEINTLKKDNAALNKDNAKLQRKFYELETSHNNLSEEFKKLKQMKENQTVSDFTVSVNGKVFHVNKEVLAVNSPVLKKLIDENRDVDHLELKDVSEKTFEEILNFMHIKNPLKNATNLVELFAASGRLEMKELMDSTAEILMQKVTPGNALAIMNLCEKYGHEKLRKKAFDELKKTFPDE
jgi:regulator of replication initiation timing